MKTKLITTEKARVLIVDLPAGASGAEVYNKEGLRTAILVYDASGMPTPYPIDNLPLGSTWLCAGNLGEVPEDVAEKIVSCIEESDLALGWEHYMSDVDFASSDYVEALATATESLRSLVEAHVKLRNPLGDNRPVDVDDLGIFTQMRRKQILAWQAEEEAVFKNPFLFFELKEKK